MTHPVLGLDIAKLTFDACLIRPDGSLRHRQRFPNSATGFAQLAQWLAKHLATTDGLHACLAATSPDANALARHLHDAQHHVSLVNPARIHDYGKSRLSRTKTDKTDAELIARCCLTQVPAGWTPPAPESSELQALVRHFEVLAAPANSISTS